MVLYWTRGFWNDVKVGWTVTGNGINGVIREITLITDTQNFDNRSVLVVMSSGGFIEGAGYTFTAPIVYVACLVNGTRVLTQNGYKAIETLNFNELVIIELLISLY